MNKANEAELKGSPGFSRLHEKCWQEPGYKANRNELNKSALVQTYIHFLMWRGDCGLAVALEWQREHNQHCGSSVPLAAAYITWQSHDKSHTPESCLTIFIFSSMFFSKTSTAICPAGNRLPEYHNNNKLLLVIMHTNMDWERERKRNREREREREREKLT